MAQLKAARGDGTHERRLQALSRADLLILDDFGLKPLTSPPTKTPTGGREEG